MKEASVKFEFDGFDVIGEGEVYSEGSVENVEVTFIGVPIRNVPSDVVRIAKEIAKEMLVENVYSSDLEF